MKESEPFRLDNHIEERAISSR